MTSSFLIKPKIELLLLVLFFLKIDCSKAQNVIWANGFGNIKSDKGTTVKTDYQGYIYVTGYFSTILALGSNAMMLNPVGNATSKEVFLAKFDSTYKCIWAKAGGAYFDDRALGMDVDSAGNVTIVGTYWEGSGIKFGANVITGSTFGHGDQGFVAHFDANGNYLWGRFICSNGGDDQALDMATDKWGNHYIAGFMSGDTLFVNGNAVKAVNANKIYNIVGYNKKNCFWLAKLDASGTPQWARTFGRQPYDSIAFKYVERDIAVCVDDSGGIYVGGGYEKYTTFNGINDTAKGGYDIFTIKYDSAGNYKWLTKGGSRKDDWINGITCDEMGHIYIVGEHRDSLIIDTLLIKNYDARDAFVCKLDAKTGKPIWGKRAGNLLGGERANDVYADANLNVYIAGDIQGGAKFNDNIIAPSGGGVQSFASRMTPDGDFLWATLGGGVDDDDRGNSIIKGKDAQVYMCGFHRSPATYGPFNLTSAGSSDVYLLRLNDSLYCSPVVFNFTTPVDTVVCPGDTVVAIIPTNKYLEVKPSNFVSANTDSSKLFFNPPITTTYTITGYNGNYCYTHDTLVFTVVISPLPSTTITVSPDSADLLDSLEVKFSCNTQNISSYLWSDSIGVLGTNSDLLQNYYADSNNFGTYCVYLKVTSNEGCINTDSACTTTKQATVVFIPNAFTPNNDGKNPTFGPNFVAKNVNLLSSYYFNVHDRTGAIIFETTNYLDTWDGKYPNGEMAELGTYYYNVKFIDAKGKIKRLKGDVHLIK